MLTLVLLFSQAFPVGAAASAAARTSLGSSKPYQDDAPRTLQAATGCVERQKQVFADVDSVVIATGTCLEGETAVCYDLCEQDAGTSFRLTYFINCCETTTGGGGGSVQDLPLCGRRCVPTCDSEGIAEDIGLYSTIFNSNCGQCTLNKMTEVLSNVFDDTTCDEYGAAACSAISDGECDCAECCGNLVEEWVECSAKKFLGCDIVCGGGVAVGDGGAGGPTVGTTVPPTGGPTVAAPTGDGGSGYGGAGDGSAGDGGAGDGGAGAPLIESASPVHSAPAFCVSLLLILQSVRC